MYPSFFKNAFLSAIIILFTQITNAGNSKLNTDDKTKNNDIRKDVINKLQSPTTSNIVYYVKSNATGLNNGSSWTNAFINLNSALSVAIAGDSIKIAKGTYTPLANYLLVKDSTIILGGYPNIGNPTNQDRNWATNQTIIDGASIYANLFTSVGSLSPYTQINGLIIQNGKNNGSTSGSSASFVSGVGISLSNSSPTISNCVFRNNSCRAFDFGGSNVSCKNNSNPKFINCFFINSDDFAYGSIYCTSNSAPIFSNCVFSGNAAASVVYATQASPKFYNCNFFKNNINYSQLPVSDQGTGTVLGVNTSNITIANSIFYLNKVGQSYDSIDVKLFSSTLNISNTITQNYNYGNSMLAANPKFRDTSSITGADGLFFTQDDGLQLTNPCSIAINKGNNATVGGSVIDMLGNNRIFESFVDLGAYEMQSNLTNVPQVLYVNALATGLNNGTSWANAFTNLQSAFNKCSDTIKIAKGTYIPSNADEYASFWLEKNRIILGGFPNTGNPSNTDRNPTLYPTILSGNLPTGVNLKSYIIVRGKNVDSTSVLDGVVIKDARPTQFDAALTFNKNGNGLVRNVVFKNTLPSNGSPSITIKDFSNPQFIDCKLDSSGGISNATNSQPLFKKCIFQNSFGIGNVKSKITVDSCIFYKTQYTAIVNSDSSDIIVSNSKFYGSYNANTANTSNWTGSIVNYASSPIVTNCLFSDSTQPNKGGSITNYDKSKPIFTKCEFKNGNAFFYGGTCYNDNSSPIFNKCVFVNSRASTAGGVFYNTNYSSPLIINCIATNCRGNGSFMFSEKSFPSVINSSIVNAPAGNIDVFVNADSSFLKLSNSILWNNFNSTVVSNKDIVNKTDPVFQPSFAVVKNSITQSFGVNGQNGNLVGIAPNFRNIANPAGFDNTFYTADDGLKVTSCSPSVNAGLNSEISGYSTDIIDNNRIFGMVVDMGAYEYQGVINNSLKTGYVNSIAAGTNDGTSWANAYNNLQDALLNACFDTIKIAMGVYKADLNNRDISFVIDRGIKIYGSYPNVGVPTDAQRNIDTYPTILSGDIGLLNDSTDNTKTIMYIKCMDTSVVVDGLIIERANGEFPNRGGGIYATLNKNLKINNVVLKNNYSFDGSAIYSLSNNLEINKCVFSNNNGGGSGTLNLTNTGVSWTNKIKKCVFFNNNASQSGGGVSCGSPATFENTVFYKNSAGIGGGAVVGGDVIANFINCNFIKNNTFSTSSAGGFGSGLYVGLGVGGFYATPILRNCIFSQNTYFNNYSPNSYSDWAVATQGFGGIQYNQPINIDYSATISTGQTTHVSYSLNNISPFSISFNNVNNPIGPDNKWFTQDDGLIPTICSMSYNKGDNAYVTDIPVDILDSMRIKNNIVDIGAYEFVKASLKIVASDTLICPNTNVTITATPQDVNAVISYTWYINSSIVGTNSNNYSSLTFNNNDTVKVKMIVSNLACNGQPDTVFSNSIILRRVTTLVPTVNITSSASSICFGNLITFNAASSNGGTNPSYQWQVNGVNVGTNSSQYASSSLQNNDIVKVILTSSFSCAVPSIVNSNSINITVTPISNASVSIIASSNVICAGAAVSFTAIPTNGGTLPVYQWKVNGINVGTNSSTFTSSSFNNNDVVSVLMISNLPCVTNTNVTSNSIIITVNSNAPASISITTTNTNFCVGTSSTFTAFAANAGTSPIYQWQVNGVNVGTNSNIFTSNTLTNGAQVKCILTSSAPCANPQIATSNIVTVTVNPILVPSITISTTTTTICLGALTTFTALQTNGGVASYQWQINGINVGSNSSTFSSSSLNNNDQVKCTLTSNLSCVSSQTASSNIITLTVNTSTVVPTIIINSITTSICSGNSLTFTATPTNAGANPSYQWQVNGANVGTNSNTFTTNTLINNSQVKCILTSSATCAIPQIVTSNIKTITVTPSVTPSISIFQMFPAICAGISTSFSSSTFNVGTSPIYQWQVNGINVGVNSNIYSSSSLNTNDQIKCIVTVNAACATTTTATSNIVTATVTPTVTPTNVINATATNICAGSSITFTASTTNGGTTPTYQWQVNGATVGTNSPTFTSNTLTNNAQVKCILISNATCATPQTISSNIITVTVNPIVAPTVSITTASTTICSGTSTTFTATAINGGVSPTFQWQVNAVNVGTNASTFTSSTLNNNDQVKCVLTSNANCVTTQFATSNIIFMNVNTATVLPTIVINSSLTTICANALITFTATATNGGATPAYQWQVNGINVGTNTNTFTTNTLGNSDQVKCILTSNATCASPLTVTSNVINITVNAAVVPTISITSTATNICAGSSATFAATSTNGGATPAYQWQVNGINVGTNANTFTTNTLINSDQVKCILTSNATCASPLTVASNVLSITVNPALVPTVSITSTATNICAGSSITFSATPTNGGATPAYQWQVNGINVGTNTNTFTTNTLGNSDQVKCILTSNAACASPQTVTSNILNITVNPVVVPTISITSTTTTICASSPITFTATATNGGATPSYQWQVNGINVGTNTNTFTTNTLNNSDQVKCILTSNATCASPLTVTSNVINITVNAAVVPTISITSTATNICAGSSATFTATSTNGGSTPTYQWQVNGTNVGTNTNTFTINTLSNSDQVKCILTSNSTCASPLTVASNVLSITVNPTLVPTVTITSTAINICAGSAITFTATSTNGGSTPAYQWQVNGINAGTNSNTFTTNTLSNSDQVKCILTSNATCASPLTVASNVINITVNAAVVPTISITSTATNICAGSSATFTATSTNGGTTPTYQWQVNGTNVGTNTNTFTINTLSNSDQVKCILTSNATCASPLTVTSNVINITVNAAVVPSVSITSTATNICAGSAITFTAATTNGGTVPTYQWQVNGINVGTNANTFTTNTLSNSDQVKCILTSNSTCASPLTVTSNVIIITVNNTVIPTASFTPSATSICSAASITFTSTSTNEGTAPIYQWKKNGVNVGTNSATYTSNSLVNGDVITLTLTSNATCASNTPVVSSPVTITVVTEIPAIIISGNTTVVLNTSTNITSTSTFGGTIPTYQWQDSTNLHTWANISGATNPSLLYTPIVTVNKLRCLMTSNSNCALGVVVNSNVLTFDVLPAVIASNQNGGISLRYYPNPVHTILTIDSLQLNQQWQSLSMIAMNGATNMLDNNISGKTKLTINVEKLSPGLYIIVLRRKEGSPAYLKFVKE